MNEGLLTQIICYVFQKAELEKEAIKHCFKERAERYNLSYYMSEDKEIALVNQWDDGRMTFF